MSNEIEGGMDYSKLKRHYELNDYASVAFNSTTNFYTVGAMAFLLNRNTFDVTKGWSLFDHGLGAGFPPPAPVAALGIPAWPSPVPAFESKHIQMLSGERAVVRFANLAAVPHLIPPGEKMEFWQRTFLIFVQRAGATSGTLHFWAEG